MECSGTIDRSSSHAHHDIGARPLHARGLELAALSALAGATAAASIDICFLPVTTSRRMAEEISNPLAPKQRVVVRIHDIAFGGDGVGRVANDEARMTNDETDL